LWELLDATPSITSGDKSLPTGALGLKLDDVSVAVVGGGKDILHHCSLEINAGEIVALVGTTGCGKSTLMGLLPRLVGAQQGTVSIGSEEQGWLDVKEVNNDELRRRVHVVTQESFLFSDTLAANLRQARPNASQEELLSALKLAAADEVIERLESGFETRLGDRGVTLSGGQRQRICLARAFLAHASILGLDDATSALDATTERTILNNLREFKQQTGQTVTVLIVSSKLSTILLADRVLLLADGQIKAQGTHEELSRTNSAYRELMGI
jgi:ABC-type multidrug transport system fused ATPase/permease subunit